MNRQELTQWDLWGHKDKVNPRPAKLPKTGYLTIEEVAAYLRVHVNTVRDWIASGEMVGFKRGQTLRIHKNQLRRFLAANKTNAEDYDVFAERRAAIARIKAVIRANLPGDLDRKSKDRIVSAIYNGIKQDLVENGMHL